MSCEVRGNPIQITIREAIPDDAAALIAHVQRLADEPHCLIALSAGEFRISVEEEERILADFAASDNSVYFVAEAEGEIIGHLTCAGGKRRATRHVATISMGIRKEWRAMGVGTKLMERGVAWGRETETILRMELAVIATNAPAIQLYRNFGFEVEGRRRGAVYRDSEYHDDLMMALLFDYPISSATS